MTKEQAARKDRAFAAMLTALKRAISLADENFVHFDSRTPECQSSYEECKIAIANATMWKTGEVRDVDEKTD